MQVTNVANNILQTIGENKSRAAILTAVAMIATVGVLLAAYHPMAATFLNSMEGKAIVIGASSLGLGALAWVFKSVIWKNSITPVPEKGKEKVTSNEEKLQMILDKVPSIYKEGETQLPQANVLFQSFGSRQPPFNEDIPKFFQTVESLSGAKIGDYTHKPGQIRGLVGNFEILTIKTEKGSRSILVRESTSESKGDQKRYRIVSDVKKYSESQMTLTLPQISAIIRARGNLHPNFRFSGLSEDFYKVLGFVLIKLRNSTDKRYHIFNDAGILQPIEREDIFFGYCIPLVQNALKKSKP